jgi:hypothetical protein
MRGLCNRWADGEASWACSFSADIHRKRLFKELPEEGRKHVQSLVTSLGIAPCDGIEAFETTLSTDAQAANRPSIEDNEWEI